MLSRWNRNHLSRGCRATLLASAIVIGSPLADGILPAASPALAQSEPRSEQPRAPSDANFSQFPGFEAILQKTPPAATVPNDTDQALLRRYRPRLFLPAGQEAPLDFYADYIARGRLSDGNDEVISEAVDRDLLNEVKLRPHVVFTHAPARAPVSPTLYGRVDRIDSPAPLTVLTYHAAFRHSGLPEGVPGWQAALLSAVADLDDWHQLDHYTAASVVLDGRGRPFAIMLQQHNYLRTYLVGEALDWPRDDRVAIDVAIRSNELYLHTGSRNRHRAVRFMTPEALDYMLGFGSAPFPSADDITEPAAEVEMRLRFLPPSDAFYVFRGFLGERRQLPGRDGPPGAFYNTVPPLKPLHRQLGAGYWRHESASDRERARSAQERFGEAWRQHWAEQQFALLLANRDCLYSQRDGCSLQ